MAFRSIASAPAHGHPIRRMVVSKRPAPKALATAAKGEDELKLFALSFTAFFICIYTLIL
ncbi:MAG: hypothetical protein K2X59_02215 [Sphingomonas sp.]|nr:hypothetical protein [Sphingomonas sp.]